MTTYELEFDKWISHLSKTARDKTKAGREARATLARLKELKLDRPAPAEMHVDPHVIGACRDSVLDEQR